MSTLFVVVTASIAFFLIALFASCARSSGFRLRYFLIAAAASIVFVIVSAGIHYAWIAVDLPGLDGLDGLDGRWLTWPASIANELGEEATRLLIVIVILRSAGSLCAKILMSVGIGYAIPEFVTKLSGPLLYNEGISFTVVMIFGAFLTVFLHSFLTIRFLRCQLNSRLIFIFLSNLAIHVANNKLVGPVLRDPVFDLLRSAFGERTAMLGGRTVDDASLVANMLVGTLLGAVWVLSVMILIRRGSEPQEGRPPLASPAVDTPLDRPQRAPEAPR